MEENIKVEGKKITLATLIVIIINVIAVGLMVLVIGKTFIQEKCTNNVSYIIAGNIEKESFNSKFTSYFRRRTGSQVRSLVEAVNSSNLSNEGTEFIVKINSKVENVIEGNVEKGYKFKGEIAKIYKVQAVKEDGLVNEVIIYDDSEDITEYEINKVTAKENDNAQKTKYYINWAGGIFMIMLHLPIFIAYLVTYCYYKTEKEKISKEINKEEIEKKTRRLHINVRIACIIIAVILIFWTIIVSYIIGMGRDEVTMTAYKPIIYIYPEEQTEIVVELGRKENLTCTYPEYKDKWIVTADVDGTLTDVETGRTYYALYWEGINSKKYSKKLEDGFVVKGEDTAKFLEEKLEILGLNEREAEEFIVYWLPKMQNNKYNYIRFQTMEEIDANMPLDIIPNPDTLIKVMMEWKGLNKFVNVEEQKLEKVERKGYTVVEWGGTEIK